MRLHLYSSRAKAANSGCSALELGSLSGGLPIGILVAIFNSILCLLLAGDDYRR